MDSFGQRLKFSREKAGLTLKELAVLVGGTQQGMWNYENRGDGPNSTFLCALSDALHVDARWLAVGVESGQEPKHSESVIRIAQAIALLPKDKRNALATLLGVTLNDVGE